MPRRRSAPVRIALALGAFLLTVASVREDVSAASAQAGETTLLVEDVLAASAEHFPAILEALARRRGAEGDVLAADGAFDVVFSADGFDRFNGTFSGGVVNTEVKRRFRPFGAQVYGGYRISDGTFPIYENINNTNTAGEAKIGAIFSLLRDRAIDPQRFRTLDARLALRQADLDVLLTKVGVQHQALLSYWRWVATGRQLGVYERLLRIARDRQKGLQEQVDQGARAAIFLTENLQNITRRQRLVTEAQRDFDIAANALSFYLRDASGEPLIPTADQLPPDTAMEPLEVSIDVGRNGDASERGAVSVASALAARPELEILKTAMERARRQVDLSRNELKPRLDLSAEVSRDFGDIGDGGPTFDSTDAIVGFRFSVPLQRREAKGRLNRARAQFEAVEQERRRIQDRIELEIRNILIDLDTSGQIARIARQEVVQSETMEQAERQRFASGASDFFLVNVREETAADARIREMLAQLQIHIARANYDAATVDIERLGLSQSPYAGVVDE